MLAHPPLARSVAIVCAAMLGACSAGGEPRVDPPVASATVTSAATPPPSARAAVTPDPPLPEGTRYNPALACEGEGHFDLTALMTDPKCALENGDPRLKVWTRSIPIEAGPFAVRLMDAGTPLHAKKQGEIELRLEIENLGGDTDLIQADDDARPRIVATQSDAPVGDLLFAPGTTRNGWTGVRWKSHALGELRVRVQTRAFKGLAHLGPGGPGVVRPYVRVEEWLEPGTYALRVEPLGHTGEAPPMGPLGTLVVAP